MSECKGGCNTPAAKSALEIIQHTCDMTHSACTPVEYEGRYYIAIKEGATGKPDIASNKSFWDGAYDEFDGAFFKAMSECAGCCDQDECEIDDPIVSIECDTRGIKITTCNGVLNMSPDITTVNGFLGGNTINIDENTPVGPIAGTEHELNINAALCGSKFPVTNYYTMKQLTTGDGSFEMRPQIQIDDGTWVTMTTGGVDQFFVNKQQDLGSEIPHTDRYDTPVLDAASTHNIRVRYILEENKLSDGASFTNGQTNFYVQRVEMKCCEDE